MLGTRRGGGRWRTRDGRLGDGASSCFNELHWTTGRYLCGWGLRFRIGRGGRSSQVDGGDVDLECSSMREWTDGSGHFLG